MWDFVYITGIAQHPQESQAFSSLDADDAPAAGISLSPQEFLSCAMRVPVRARIYPSLTSAC
jgi:hypothetical protein